ncbi:TCP-1/cpn60 chaperonin family protein [Paenibacillus radicibacter]|uniref:TCP-1/cpn60 chaperonin family protein n=1 Tax=Paenibacillus radicibacter TaxID=2972488 RepID=UPI00280BB547|nr:TCP-1/cpn60 chaperonin family protein [Paenibacillus radicibacter]
MLVGGQGEVIITNDGVTILEKMDVTHPAARLMVGVAQSQQRYVGDGTTTATVLAGALVAECVAHVTRGVPVAKVVRGLQDGVATAVLSLRERSRAVAGIDDPVLARIAYTAGREQRDIAALVLEAAQQLGLEQLSEEAYRFSDSVLAHADAVSEVWPGIVLRAMPMNPGAAVEHIRRAKVLVLRDELAPEAVAEEALVTEAGFQQYMHLRELFREDVRKLVELGVGLIAADRGVDPEAEQICSDHGIMVLQRVPKRELEALCTYTGAKPLRRMALKKSVEELRHGLGYAEELFYDDELDFVKISGGGGARNVTVIVGASTQEVVGERTRIAKDAASAVQAAVRGGYVPGGGAVEMAIAQAVEKSRECVTGMESFGIQAVAAAIRKPLGQMMLNSGYNPLEKVEALRAEQLLTGSDEIGVNCDTGELVNMMEAGVIDPTNVKIHALRSAGEVAAAVLRIHTVIKMK